MEIFSSSICLRIMDFVATALEVLYLSSVLLNDGT